MLKSHCWRIYTPITMRCMSMNGNRPPGKVLDGPIDGETTSLGERPPFEDSGLMRLIWKNATNFTKGRIASPGIYAMNALRLTELLQTSGPRRRRNPNGRLDSRS